MLSSIAGNYMSDAHTVEHMREVFWEAPSKSLWRDQWESWHNAGMPDIYAKAHDFVQESIRGWAKTGACDFARTGRGDRSYLSRYGSLAG